MASRCECSAVKINDECPVCAPLERELYGGKGHPPIQHHIGPTSDPGYQRKRRALKVQQGKCSMCAARKHTPGYKTCATCRERHYREKEEFKIRGICVRCRRTKRAPSRTLCKKCLVYERTRFRARRKKL